VNDLVRASTDAESIGMSPEVFAALSETRSFLFERVYEGVVAPATRNSVQTIVSTLLQHYSAGNETQVVTAVDYVAGMTDRFALRAFEQVVGGQPPPVGVQLG
jgi:dGTP triphosphohydrolase